MKAVNQLTDDELFDAIREQVKKSRYTVQGHDRKKTREISNEMKKRGWNKNTKNL